MADDGNGVTKDKDPMMRFAGKTVFLAVPCGTQLLQIQTANAIQNCFTSLADVRLLTASQYCSALTGNFNGLWCMALNHNIRNPDAPIDYFAMIHSDMGVTEPDWLYQLLCIIEDCNVEMASAIIPIKDGRGLTSTGFDIHPWRPRRLTITETLRLPETFTADDIMVKKNGAWQPKPAIDLSGPLAPLLPNTGCWACKFTSPWVKEFAFSVGDRIVEVRDKDGKITGYAQQFQSEDWNLGRFMNARGIKFAVTSAIHPNHFGTFNYSVGTEPWGNARDEETIRVYNSSHTEVVSADNVVYNPGSTWTDPNKE